MVGANHCLAIDPALAMLDPLYVEPALATEPALE